MQFYIFQADTYCPDCTTYIKGDLRARAQRTVQLENWKRIPVDETDESSYDSDYWPKGPYDNEESDTPQHCAACHVFLEQPLTQDGYKYVLEALRGDMDTWSDVERTWFDYYSDDWSVFKNDLDD